MHRKSLSINSSIMPLVLSLSIFNISFFLSKFKLGLNTKLSIIPSLEKSFLILEFVLFERIFFIFFSVLSLIIIVNTSFIKLIPYSISFSPFIFI